MFPIVALFCTVDGQRYKSELYYDISFSDCLSLFSVIFIKFSSKLGNRVWFGRVSPYGHDLTAELISHFRLARCFAVSINALNFPGNLSWSAQGQNMRKLANAWSAHLDLTTSNKVLIQHEDDTFPKSCSVNFQRLTLSLENISEVNESDCIYANQWTKTLLGKHLHSR